MAAADAAPLPVVDLAVPEGGNASVEGDRGAAMYSSAPAHHLASDEHSLDGRDRVAEDDPAEDAVVSRGKPAPKIYQTQYPVLPYAAAAPPPTGTADAMSPCKPSGGARENSLGNSCTSIAREAGGSIFDALQGGPLAGDSIDGDSIDPAQDFTAFLDTVCTLPVGSCDEPPSSTMVEFSMSIPLPGEGGDKGRVAHPGVYQGGIQKKSSNNPLHGALQAAVRNASSSHQTFQYESLREGSMPGGQDDMCTPQSQFRRDDHSMPQLERRHTSYVPEVYHGSPIGMAPYEQVQQHPYHHPSQMYDETQVWQKMQQMQGVRRTMSANTHSSSHLTYSREDLSRHLGGSSKNNNSNSSASGKRDQHASPSNNNSNNSNSSGGARGPRGSSSRYRGVTQHRRTKRWEAHVWDKGKQVYLGGFESEHRAGRAYDVVVLKTRGPDKCQTNFPIEEYKSVIPWLGSVTRDELVLLLRRRSKGFSRGSSKYIGVTKHKCGKWEARISNSNKSMGSEKKKEGEGAAGDGHQEDAPPPGQGTTARKYTYLGLFDSELEAARTHDKAAVTLFGLHANTNFPIQNYPDELMIHKPGKKEIGMLELFSNLQAQEIM
ncbi:AP2-like ethylene-responsive transcription factor [Chloropicon primus]|uniref:AP2-like ethylene-responsive transcription factor n=1 Tax=Chloropicon primus TaxID=1764295 RepID=A0A5B8MGF4_9CHLO|nr:AP2-like ethylene-responsive transcription factor [Chloropicon primus]UPQ97632.1 AP2-like ethylene-responsive transcription factor [Chloropicon primus]|mmetsp:Transcript_11634/g.32246  ORF Transcript_11634/g.32246 Transcript_11634/m.32246 type:complete len:603 (+) Transcript_11634:278-2086(+)|eukprot:QDZ18422.1 AP2-like ethylene-responsive transcription factor [Chloropicon primus]